MKQIDQYNIDEIMTEGKSLTRDMAKLLGLDFPLVNGWKHRLIGRWVHDDVFDKIAALKESAKNNPRRMMKARKRIGARNTGDLFGDLL